VPEDDILGQLLCEDKRWIFNYHEHDSLLENKIAEGLSADERKAAWNDYQTERKRATEPAQMPRTYASYAEFLDANQQLMMSMQAGNGQAMSVEAAVSLQRQQQFQMQQMYQNQMLLQQKREEDRRMAEKLRASYAQAQHLNSYNGIAPNL
jgi:hypothetical protein